MAAPVIGVGIDRIKPTWALVLLILAQAVTAGAIWWIGERRAKRIEDERAAERGETLLDLGYSLEPLVREVARTASLPKGRQRSERSGLLQAILSAAIGLSADEDRLRSSYFKLVGSASGERALVHERSAGRGAEAKARFVEGTVSGDAALQMVEKGEHLFCDNVLEAPPPGWEPSQRGEYKTFISVPVGVPGRPLGMLTLDATRVGSLKAEDVRMLVVLGHLLGIAEVLTE